MKIAKLAAAAAGAVLVLAGCGSFDSKKSGESLIRNFISEHHHGVTLRSVDCPSGVSKRIGGSFDCKVVLHFDHRSNDTPGTITVHMVTGNKVEIMGPQDVHLR